MSIFAVKPRNVGTPHGWWTILFAVLAAVAFAATVVLVAFLVGLSQAPGDGRVPNPEPAPAPVPQR
jgi:hypothetical protein